jgi:hypothetical protein
LSIDGLSAEVSSPAAIVQSENLSPSQVEAGLDTGRARAFVATKSRRRARVCSRIVVYN